MATRGLVCKTWLKSEYGNKGSGLQDMAKKTKTGITFIRHVESHERFQFLLLLPPLLLLLPL
jgi:hypothetical protein